MHEDLSRELATVKEQLRSLIERNADAIVVVDDGGTVQFANPAAEKLFGRGVAQIQGTQLGLPLVEGETTEIDILATSNGPMVAEMRVVETEWDRRHALLAVLRDITERKRGELERAQLLEEQLARAQAEQALRERDEFMALASHELKTPVSTLSATAQLLQRQLERQQQLSPDQLTRALERVHDQSRRLTRLIDHLLDVSRINAGKLNIEPELVDLRDLVEHVVSSCQVTTTRHTLDLQAPDRLEAFVDPIRIEQVVTNLVDNAIKYSPGGGRILVTLAMFDRDRASLAVRDHGLGIPEDRVDRLFERFYRAHSAGNVSGLGLGLFITQHIIEMHGGSITVEAPEGGGSLFTVLLPVQRAHGLH